MCNVHVWKRSRRQSGRPYASGYAQGRSRIEAILQQHFVAERLRVAGFSFISCFHDIANAFPSMDHGRLREVLRQAAHPDDFPLLVQRVPGSGTLQGDAIAEDLFLEAYHPVVDAWTADLGWQHCDYQVLAFSPLDLATIDLAVTTFADDLCRKIFVESPEDANQKVRRSNQALGPWPQQAWHRTPANKNMWLSLAANTSTATTAKFSINNCYQEKQSPLPNIWAAFRPTIFLLCMSLISGYPALLLHGAHFEVSAWYSRGLPWRGLRGIFLGMVYEVLFSGLEVLLLSTGHLQRLDRVVLGYGCKLMRGKGCIQTQTDTGDTKYKELPNLEVFSYLGVAPAYTELRIRRLKFLQMLARDPFKHVQIITAIFGTFDFDADPTLDPLQGVDPSANKYALLFWKDLQALACLDSAHWLLEIADGNIIAFLTDLASDFIHVDVTELRAADLSVHIPPPGQACAHPVEDDIEPLPDEPLQHCNIVLEDGSVCGKQFHSLRDLLLHQRRSKAFNHSTVSDFFQSGSC